MVWMNLLNECFNTFTDSIAILYTMLFSKLLVIRFFVMQIIIINQKILFEYQKLVNFASHLFIFACLLIRYMVLFYYKLMPLNDFQIITKLGQGAYSCVYKVKRLVDTKQYAMKKVKLNDLNDREKDNALNEVRILASIHHPNIIGYKQSFIDKKTNHLYIIMQYADDGDLYSQIQEHSKSQTYFPEQTIWSIIIQVSRGLKALHDNRILHRDIKSANVFLFKNGLVKLGDMNVSKVIKGLSTTQTGTPYYSSPEVWKDQPYDKKSDMWSLGCVIYQAIALKPPFRANDMEGLYRKVIRGFYPRLPSLYSNQLEVVLKLLIQVTPHLRSNCDKLLEFPIVSKHIQTLPQSLLDVGTGKNEVTLLKTIRIQNKVSKGDGVQLPKARYNYSIQNTNIKNSLPLLNKSVSYSTDQAFQAKNKITDFSRDSMILKKKKAKRQTNMSTLQMLQPENQSKSIISKQTVKFCFEQMLQNKQTFAKQMKHNLIKKMQRSPNKLQPLSLQKTPAQQAKKAKYNDKKHETVDHDRSQLPNIYHGRLRHVSPENLKKLIKKQQEKKKIYSIIGNN